MKAEALEAKMKMLREKEQAKMEAQLQRADALAARRAKAASERAVAKEKAAASRVIVTLCTKVLTRTSLTKMKIQIALNGSKVTKDSIPNHVVAELQTAEKNIDKLEKLAQKYLPGDKALDAPEKNSLQGVEELVKAADKAIKTYKSFEVEALKSQLE